MPSFQQNILNKIIMQFMVEKNYISTADADWEQEAALNWKIFADREGYVYTPQPDINAQEPRIREKLTKLYDIELAKQIENGDIVEYVKKRSIRDILPMDFVLPERRKNNDEEQEVITSERQAMIDSLASEIQASIKSVVNAIEANAPKPKRTIRIDNLTIRTKEVKSFKSTL